MAILYSQLNADGSYEVINQVKAKQLGWETHDIEYGWDGKFYLVGQVPEKPQSVINEERIAELKANMAATDSIVLELAENALFNGGNLIMPVDVDTDYATILNNRASWRAELKQLID